MNTTTNTHSQNLHSQNLHSQNLHSQNLHSQNSNPQNSPENNSYPDHYLKPSSPCHPIMEKLILKSIISFDNYIERQGTPSTIEDFQANSTTLYKIACTYTQHQSLEIKHRQLLMKEEAHRLKYYVPAQSPPPPPSPVQLPHLRNLRPWSNQYSLPRALASYFPRL